MRPNLEVTTQRPWSAQYASSAIYNSGGYLDVRRISPELAAELENNGINEAELDRIAGDDHLIDTREELGELFQRIAVAAQPPTAGAHSDTARYQVLYQKLYNEALRGT